MFEIAFAVSDIFAPARLGGEVSGLAAGGCRRTDDALAHTAGLGRTSLGHFTVVLLFVLAIASARPTRFTRQLTPRANNRNLQRHWQSRSESDEAASLSAKASGWQTHYMEE
jgi:hypothetical protein